MDEVVVASAVRTAREMRPLRIGTSVRPGKPPPRTASSAWRFRWRPPREFGIRVNSIAPGVLDPPISGDTPLTDAYVAAQTKSVVYPRRPALQASSHAWPLELLTTDYVNGETARADGGLRMAPR